MREQSPTSSAALPGVLRRLAGEQSAVLSREQLRASGVDRHDIRAQVRARRWRVVGLAVVLHRGPLSRSQQRWVAYFQTRDRGALAGFSVLELAGLRGWPREEIHVVVPRGWKVWRIPGLVVHESRRFDPALHAVDVAGLPCTSVSRSAIDAATWTKSKRAAVGLLAAVTQQRLCSAGQLGVDLGRAGRIRHVRAFREALRDIGDGAESLAEIDMSALVREAGLPEPRRQVLRREAGGRPRYVDLEVDLPDGTVLMIEVDGAHHLDPEQAWADQRRQNALAGPGRVLLRFPVFAVRHEPGEVVASLRRVRAAHSTRDVSQNEVHAPRTC